MKKKAKQKKLLEMVVIPFIPRYDATGIHYGANGEEEKRTVKNMVKSDREVYEMAKQDLSTLKKNSNQHSEVYNSVVFLGTLDGENSLSAAIKHMEEKYQCPKDLIEKIIINIVAHGNPATIGNRTDLSLDPDGDYGLSALVYNYLIENISPQSQCLIRFLSCNSAYADYQNEKVDKEKAREAVLKSSFIGKFYRGMTANGVENDQFALKLDVEGFRGFIGRTNKNKISASSTRDNEGGEKFTGLNCVKFLITKTNKTGDAEVILPQNFRYKVSGVENSMTATEAIEATINPNHNHDHESSENNDDIDNDIPNVFCKNANVNKVQKDVLQSFSF